MGGLFALTARPAGGEAPGPGVAPDFLGQVLYPFRELFRPGRPVAVEAED